MRHRRPILLIVLILPVLILARWMMLPIQKTVTATATSQPLLPDFSTASGFILEWQASRESPRIAYRISSRDGVHRVRAWATAHAAQLETSARIGPFLAAIPNDRLWVVERDGAPRKASLVVSYPADFSVPRVQQTLVENLTKGDLESLRRVFTETGVVEDRPPIP